MRRIFCLFSFIILLQRHGNGQQSFIDSLEGFDGAKAHQIALENNFTPAEIQKFVKNEARRYIKDKFGLSSGTTKAGTSKFTPSKINSANCNDVDFEAQPVGNYNTQFYTAWNLSETHNAFLNSVLCPTAPATWSNTQNFSIVFTPYSDAKYGMVPHSPLGGTKVALINRNYISSQATRIKQTFSVTSSNCLYYYAYLGVIDDGGHSCCDNGFEMFNFYDCNNNLISSLCDTIAPPSPFLGNCTDLTGWAVSSYYYYSTNWIVKLADLSPYLGSCVTVEVISSHCSPGAHYGYMYYDAKCSASGINVNNAPVAINSFTSCLPTATLSVLGCNSGTWTGPATSTISGIVSASVLTNVNGIYTLTASDGSVITTNTLQVTVNPIPPIGISSSTTDICLGGAVNLQATGATAGSTFTWSAMNNSVAIQVSPTSTSGYTVVSTNSLGCKSAASTTVTVHHATPVTITSSSAAICAGDSVVMVAQPGTGVTHLWSTGATDSLIVSAPSSHTLYSVVATTSAGCTSTAYNVVSVHPYPAAKIIISDDSLCAGETTSLSAGPTGTNLVSWSTGQGAGSFTVSPPVTSAYVLTVTGYPGCESVTEDSVFVFAHPVVNAMVSKDPVCAAEVFSVEVSGTNVHTVVWNTGATVIQFSSTATQNSIYHVTVTSAEGCQSVDSVPVKVAPLPVLSVSEENVVICAGEETWISALSAGQVSYNWSHGPATASIVVQPLVTTVYTVVVTDSMGCSAKSSVTVQVEECSGLPKNTIAREQLSIQPNPASKSVIISSPEKLSGEIVNENAQVILTFILDESNDFMLHLNDLTPGIYYVRAAGIVKKLVVVGR